MILLCCAVSVIVQSQLAGEAHAASLPTPSPRASLIREERSRRAHGEFACYSRKLGGLNA
jgi:hypothetical protein